MGRPLQGSGSQLPGAPLNKEASKTLMNPQGREIMRLLMAVMSGVFTEMPAFFESQFHPDRGRIMAFCT